MHLIYFYFFIPSEKVEFSLNLSYTSSMNLYQFKSFLALSRLLHFGKAGKSCNLSPSALSRQIKSMEDELGVVLFERDNRTVKLTDAGRTFASYVDDALNNWDRVKGRLKAMTDVLSGDIRIYCSVTACTSILPDILRRFRQNYPSVHLQIETGDAADAVKKVEEGSADLAVAANPGNLSSDLLFHSIMVSPLVFVEADKVSGTEKKLESGNSAWNDMSVILAKTGTARQRFDSWCSGNEIEPEVYAEVAGNEAILALSSLGCGVGLVPQLVLEKSALNAELKMLHNGPDMGVYDIGICAKKSRIEDPVVQAFWNTTVGSAG